MNTISQTSSTQSAAPRRRPGLAVAVVVCFVLMAAATAAWLYALATFATWLISAVL